MPDGGGHMDLVVRGGTAVTEGGRFDADIGIANGRIVQLGGRMRGARELDATGLIVTPGGVDPHVHLTPPTREAEGWAWVDDFETGTRAALAGGITSVGNISFPGHNETLADAVAQDRAEADRMALTDYFLHPVLMNPDEANLEAIGPLHAAGFTSIKVFLSFHRFDHHVAEYLAALRRVAASGGVALAHCEDAAIIGCCCELLRERGLTGPEHFPAARPLQAEVVATQRAVAFAETTGCPLYVVHLSSDRALEACHEARARGVPVYVETRPLYLHLTGERFSDPDGGKYTGAPPLRHPLDVAALWAGLGHGGIDTLATDHAPWMLADKLAPVDDPAEFKQGVADLETCLPMLYDAGVRSGRLSLERFVAVGSTNAAKLFGLYPRKGTIAVGADADLVVWDPATTRVVDGATMHSRSDYSPYDGREVTGWPRWTISRGEVVLEDGVVHAAAGRGRLAPRGRHRPL